MKFIYLICITMLALFVSTSCHEKAAASSKRKASSSASAIGKDFLFSMERTGCRGYCPAFKFTIDANGMVNYEGKRNVKNIGKFTKKLTSAQLSDLNQAIVNANYNGFEDKYDNPGIADLPSCITSYTHNGKTKTISNRANAPQALIDLEKKAEEMVGQEGFEVAK